MSGAANHGVEDDTAAEDVLTVLDRLDISTLLSSYGLFTDQGRRDEWLDLFIEDAVYEIPGLKPFASTEARREMFDGIPPGLHMCNPPVIRPGIEVGMVQAEQTFMYRERATGRFRTGWYEDELVRHDGGWRFARRRIRFLG